MVYMLLGTGFEETEAIAPVDLLRRAGIEVQTVGLNGAIVYGSHGIGVQTDIQPQEMQLQEMDMLVLPGGLGGVASIRACQAAMDALRYARDNDCYIAAICAGPTVLADIGITDGKTITCYPGCEESCAKANFSASAAVIDGKLITGTSAGCAVEFGLALIEALKGKVASDTIRKQIVIR